MDILEGKNSHGKKLSLSKNLQQKKSSKRRLFYFGGGLEIRTLGSFHFAGFQDRCFRPLSQTSTYLIFFCQLLNLLANRLCYINIFVFLLQLFFRNFNLIFLKSLCVKKMKKNMINLKNVGAFMRKNAAMFLFLESQLGQQNKPACKTKKS